MRPVEPRAGDRDAGGRGQGPSPTDSLVRRPVHQHTFIVPWYWLDGPVQMMDMRCGDCYVLEGKPHVAGPGDVPLL